MEVVTLAENCFFFLNLEILPLPNTFFLSFMIRNKNLLVNSEVYHIDTRQHANFHQPFVNLTKYEKRVYCLVLRVFSKLPTYIKQSLIIPRSLNWFYRNFCMKIPFTLWISILNFKKVKYIYI